jgi:hypothetical protein
MEVKAIQAEHPGWTYDRAFGFAVEAAGAFGAFTRRKLTRDPRLQKEADKFAVLEQREADFEIEKHAKMLAETRKLMEADRNLTFHLAFHKARELHPELRSKKDGGPSSP